MKTNWENIHTIYHDSDESVYCFDKDENDVPYLDSWPEIIGDVQLFCRARDINYRYG